MDICVQRAILSGVLWVTLVIMIALTVYVGEDFATLTVIVGLVLGVYLGIKALDVMNARPNGLFWFFMFFQWPR